MRFLPGRRLGRPRGRLRGRRVVSAYPLLRDERGTCHRELSVETDGRLLVVGHDLGPGAPGGEYEFTRTVAARDVPQVVALLGLPRTTSAQDLLDALRARFPHSAAVEAWLAEHGVESELFTWY